MTVNPFTDEFFMKEAIKEAFSALEKDEVPVGCVIVCENQIISRAHNFVETLKRCNSSCGDASNNICLFFFRRKVSE